MKKIHSLTRISVSLFLVLVLAGCYMPIRFDAEIEITRGGYYDFKFDGYLAKVELFRGLKEGTIDREEEEKQIGIIERDFSRDSSLKEFKYLKMGHFKVYWERNGDLIKTKSVTFFNATELFLGIRYNSKTRRITVAGKSLTNNAKKKLDQLGLGWTGQIRVFTDAKVITHNATTVKKNKRKGGRFMTYIWDLKNIYAPTPNLVLQAG